MTEKRFSLKKDTGTDECNLDNLYDDNTYIASISSSGSEMICYLLNELHEENMMLKEYNNKLMKQPLLFDVQTIPDTMKIIEANTQLEEENEQLKHRIKKLQNELNNCEEDYVLEEYL